MQTKNRNLIVAIVLATSVTAGLVRGCVHPAYVNSHEKMPPKHFSLTESVKANEYASHLRSVGWIVKVKKTAVGYDVTGHD